MAATNGTIQFPPSIHLGAYVRIFMSEIVYLKNLIYFSGFRGIFLIVVPGMGVVNPFAMIFS